VGLSGKASTSDARCNFEPIGSSACDCDDFHVHCRLLAYLILNLNKCPLCAKSGRSGLLRRAGT